MEGGELPQKRRKYSSTSIFHTFLQYLKYNSTTILTKKNDGPKFQKLLRGSNFFSEENFSNNSQKEKKNVTTKEF